MIRQFMFLYTRVLFFLYDPYVRRDIVSYNKEQERNVDIVQMQTKSVSKNHLVHSLEERMVTWLGVHLGS